MADSSAQWFVVWTHSNSERLVHGQLAARGFDAFLPMDVQNNKSSPLFGTFYNSEYRQFRLQFRFEREPARVCPPVRSPS